MTEILVSSQTKLFLSEIKMSIFSKKLAILARCGIKSAGDLTFCIGYYRSGSQGSKRTDGRLLSRFGQRNEEIGMFITFLPKNEFNGLLKMNIFRPSCAGNGAHGRAEDIRTIIGSWPSQGLAAHAVRIAAGSPAPKFRHFHISR